MAKKTGYDKCVHILQELKKAHPNYTMGQHISTALSDYGDCWGITDNELAFALEKYRTEMELNEGIPDKDLEKIIEEGKNLDKIRFDDEEEELDFYN